MHFCADFKYDNEIYFVSFTVLKSLKILVLTHDQHLSGGGLMFAIYIHPKYTFTVMTGLPQGLSSYQLVLVSILRSATSSFFFPTPNLVF